MCQPKFGQCFVFWTFSTLTNDVHLLQVMCKWQREVSIVFTQLPPHITLTVVAKGQILQILQRVAWHTYSSVVLQDMKAP